MRMQESLAKMDALLAEFRAEGQVIKEKLAAKEAFLASALKAADTVDAHALAMQKQMPKLREACDVLKDV